MASDEDEALDAYDEAYLSGYRSSDVPGDVVVNPYAEPSLRRRWEEGYADGVGAALRSGY